MSLKKIALTAVAAAALLAPTMTGADAAHKNNKTYKVYKNNNKHVSLRHGNVNTRGIDRKIENHQNRIRAGRIKGDLTFREVRKLRRGLNRIREARYFAKRDGNVTRSERRELRSMLSDHSERIYRLRHNHRTANKFFRKFSKYYY